MTSRVEIILKDYELIRAEAVYRLGARQTITTFFVPVVGTIVAARPQPTDSTGGNR